MKTKLPKLIIILVLTVLTAVLWISFEVFRSLTKQQTPGVPSEISQALTPALDKNTINDIKNRQFSDKVPTTVITISSTTPLPTPVEISTPIASESGTPTSIPTSTPTTEAGGTIQ